VRFDPVPLGGAWLIGPDRHADERGSFARAFCEREFADHGLPIRFPQCNVSTNTSAGTLRGMHFNVTASAEAKLVRCTRGAIHDVVVDLRPDSPTVYRSFGVELSADNGLALFVPKGFAHGFVTLRDATDVFYHMSEFYDAGAARGARWNDPAFAIDWPRRPTVISDRDAAYPDFVAQVVEG
jgi:dTDP-4-dehydrorhamnose 3,5-epimerase